MPNTDSLRSSIQSLLESFTAQLEALVNQAAVDRVMTALGGDAPAAAGKRRGRPKGSGRKPGRPAGRPARGGKRSSDEVDAMAERLVAYVKSNPGQGLEGIARGLGTSTKELKLPVIKLLASRQIKKTGQKRGTKYFVGGRGPGRPAKARAKGVKRAKRKTKRARKAKRATKARRAKGGRKAARATKARVVRRRRAPRTKVVTKRATTAKAVTKPAVPTSPAEQAA